jgi:hypothetical protein
MTLEIFVFDSEAERGGVAAVEDQPERESPSRGGQEQQ